MATKQAKLPTVEQLITAITALRAQRRRHAEALAEIDAALQQLGAGEDLAAAAPEDPRFEEALGEVNQRYGDVLRRLA